jgi:hypothetical protein
MIQLISTVCLMAASFFLGMLYGRTLKSDEFDGAKSIYVKIEKHDDLFFAYENKTSKYLGKSDDYNTLIQYLKDSFPDYIIYIIDQE